MWHKPCRTFHPWCPCIKTRCLCCDYIISSCGVRWKKFPRYWPFVRGIHRWPVNSPHKGKWRGALMFCMICAWINGWVNNSEAGDLRRHRAHYDVTAMIIIPVQHLTALGDQQTQRWRHPQVSTAFLVNIQRHIGARTKCAPFRRRYFQMHFLQWNVGILIKFSMKFVPKGPINNIPALVQIMAWRRPGDKPLSEPLMARLATHICVTCPHWVKKYTIPI